MIAAGGLAVVLLVACSPDRVAVQPTSRSTEATAGSCDADGMTAEWESFAQDFNNGSVDVDESFAPDFEIWTDPTDSNEGGASRPQLAEHFADLHRFGVRLPADADFVLYDGNAGTYEYDDNGMHAFGQLNCVTGRIRTMQITNWPPDVGGGAPTD